LDSLSVDLFVEDENDEGSTIQRNDFEGKESLIDKSSTGGLDQTIVIGEMEEGNIFDDL